MVLREGKLNGWRSIMTEYEFKGKTTEEAIETASRELNVPAEDLDIDVIEPGSPGIFGIVGGKKAKVRVTVKGVAQGPEENGLGLAKQTLEHILSLIPVETTVIAEHVDGKIALNIVGDKSGLLIGRKGKTLDAIQFIVNKIVNKTLERKVRVIIDSENYRHRRRESLVQLAVRMGEKAKRIKKPVSTSPLNPHDRRIIHLTLKDDEHLDTRSSGEGLMKKVIIIPRRGY
jgi:spoIIIJ-associated protein